MGVQQPIFLLCLSVSILVASLLILKSAPVPFFWIEIVWAAGLIMAMFLVRGSWLRAILLNVAILLSLGAAAEAYLALHEYTPPTYLTPLYVPDEALGWVPIKSNQARGIKASPTGLFHRPGGLLFDTTYTIDSNGLRVAPPYRKEGLAGTALFFGCSFTFGEGLKDNETLPYQVGELSRGRYRTLNFGFQGYSPAQMLSELELGMVQKVVDTTPQYAFYVAIPTHVWRVAGRVAWAQRTPRYVLESNGNLHLAGHFDNRQDLGSRLGLSRDSRLRGQLNKSAMWRMLPMLDPSVNDDDIRLYFAVVGRAQELLKAQYPNIQFRVILHPAMVGEPDRPVYETLRDGFRQRGIPVDLVEDILPGYKIDRSAYILNPRDAHPSALSNRLLAEHILSEMGQ